MPLHQMLWSDDDEDEDVNMDARKDENEGVPNDVFDDIGKDLAAPTTVNVQCKIGETPIGGKFLAVMVVNEITVTIFVTTSIHF